MASMLERMVRAVFLGKVRAMAACIVCRRRFSGHGRQTRPSGVAALMSRYGLASGRFWGSSATDCSSNVTNTPDLAQNKGSQQNWSTNCQQSSETLQCLLERLRKLNHLVFLYLLLDLLSGLYMEFSKSNEDNNLCLVCKISTRNIKILF